LQLEEHSSLAGGAVVPFEILHIQPEHVHESLVKWQALASSKIIVPEYQKNAMETEIAGEAIQEYFTTERKKIFKRILQDEAYLALKTSRAQAQAYAAAAIAIEKGPGDLPFIVGFMEQNLRRLVEKPVEEAPGGGRIILP
jgi:hypothetical protein